MSQDDDPTADEFAERLFASALGMAETLSVYIGDRLGWYRTLADSGPRTPVELAERTGTDARYCREWLEHQAVSGILAVQSTPDAAPDERRYALAPGPAEVLTDERSLSYLAPLARMFAAAGPTLPDLLQAYRTGEGVSWEQLGPDAREAQADMNRPWFDRLPDALGRVDGIRSLLEGPGARVADVGSGAGWSSIALALAHPGLQVDGFDVDDPSIEAARRNALQAGVAERVRFHNADADGLSGFGPFDAAFAFECLHDMPRPVDVLRSMRLAVRDGGPIVIMDEAVAETFTAPGDDIERIMYGFSLFVCLPDSMSHRPTVATGTVMRPTTLQKYAREAGFRDVEVLPVGEFGFFRFYSLVP